MRNIETTNKGTIDRTAMYDDHPETSVVLRSMLNRDIQSVISYQSTISVDCKNGVVTLNGHFANDNDKNKALCKAISNPGVCKVINNAS